MDLTTFSDEPKPQKRNVSNSEVTAFLACKRAYDFAFIDNIAPFEASTPLARGSVGHQFFEQYWRARMEGYTHEQSMEYGYGAFINPNEPTRPDVIMNAQFLVTRVMTSWEEVFTKYWEPLGVEETLHLPLTSTLNLTIRYDLYYRDRRNGKRNILDWKFTYDFWSANAVNLNPQMPKYIGCMRANGYEVDGGELFQIRTRQLGAEKSADPKNLWRITPYRPSKANMRSMLKQHVSAAMQIERHRALTPEERKDESIPVYNMHGPCKYCNFADLCTSVTEGKEDLSVDIRVNYKQNTYGYNKETDPLEGL